jgi:hypothetical protein
MAQSCRAWPSIAGYPSTEESLASLVMTNEESSGGMVELGSFDSSLCSSLRMTN